MRLAKTAIAIGLGIGFMLPSTAAFAGLDLSSMVITIEETTVEVDAIVTINVALQSAAVGSCEMEGDLELIVDGVTVQGAELLDTSTTSVNDHDFLVQFSTLGDHSINATYTPRDIAAPTVLTCPPPGLQLNQIITVVPAATTTSIEDESTTTSEEVPESVEDSVAATLVKAGTSNGNSLAVAAMILIIAGAGFALIRRRT
jgi:LPXTG-motif cell wall-anchored protein